MDDEGIRERKGLGRGGRGDEMYALHAWRACLKRLGLQAKEIESSNRNETMLSNLMHTNTSRIQ